MIFVCETEERILLKKFCEMDDRDLTEKGWRPGNVWRLLSWRGIFRAGFWPAGAGKRAPADSVHATRAEEGDKRSCSISFLLPAPDGPQTLQ